MSNSITAIILTLNEEHHIRRCIDSLDSLVERIIIIDSYSNDKTVKEAQNMGVEIFQNKWKNYATQFNWALQNCNIITDWVWRIDADEFVEEPDFNLKQNLAQASPSISGIYIKRKVVFMGRPLLHGGWFPVWHLKIWRNKKGFCENRWMDEHIKLTEGETIKLDIVQVDENLNDITWWTQKHNSYASREMIDLLDMRYQIFTEDTVIPRLFGTDEQRKRWLKLRYLSLPLFIRPFCYFFYRYFFKLGFLDGKAGFIWHILQGFWYRFLVDVKIFELHRKFKGDKHKIIDYIKNELSV